MKCPIRYSKEEILKATQERGNQLNTVINGVLQDLCKCSAFISMVKSFVKQRGGNTEDAEDLIQESLSTLAINLVSRKYKGDSSIENYAFGICKFKYMNVMTKKGIDTTTITDDDRERKGTDDIEGSMLTEEANGILWKIVAQVSGHCPKYLKLWAMGYTHREIGEKMDVTEKRARKNTSECRSRLRKLISERPELNSIISNL